MSKIPTVKTDAAQKFINKYGIKPADFLNKAETKLQNLGDLKELSPEKLKKYNEIQAAITEALNARGISNKISLGIK